MRLLLFLSLMMVFTTKAQTIKGTITDSIGVVPFAIIILKNNKESVLHFTNSNETGSYKLIVKSPLDSLFLEVSGLIYEPKTIALKGKKVINDNIIVDIRLEPRVTELKEVIIKKQESIIQKRDTLEYNPASFRDGSEKVVEDLLKKLPGIKVEENGTIKYKGKEIKKMLLDGDDLFDANYKIGSKNISVDMIEKVQGIEKYEENSLLKGIKDSDDVVLNLVLKKGKTDFSGNSTLGYGVEDRYYATLSGILINKKLKTFAVASYNNIGQNATPYNFSSEIISLERLKSQNLYSKSIINEGYFNSLLDGSFHNQNNTLYTTVNSLNKIFKKSNFKINLGFYNDELSRVNKNNSRILLENQTFKINETNSLKKRPKLFDVNIHFSNKEKDNFHWEYLGKLNKNELSFKDKSSNNEFIQNNLVQSDQFSIYQNINSTFKISENKALLTSVLFSKSGNAQNLETSPPTIIDDIGLVVAANQQGEFQKQFTAINSSFFATNGKLKYAIHSCYFDLRNSLSSNLLNQENQSLGNEFSNKNNYNVKNFNVNPVLVYNEKKYSFKFGINAIYNDLHFNDTNENLKNKTVFITPKLTAIYKFNSHNNLNYNYSFNQILPEEDQLFTGIIQTGYRDFKNNDLSLEYLKTHSHSLTYAYNNFFELTQFNFTLTHDYRPNNYFQKTTINQSITISNQFFAKISNKDYGVNISGEKYVHILRTTIQCNTTYNLSFDNNLINDSDFRAIKTDIFTFNLTMRRAVKKRLVIENKTQYLNSNIKVEKENLNNNFQMATNQTKIVLKSKNFINSNIIGNFISPNLRSNDNYFFLDYEIDYTPKNKNITYSLIAKNLTNNKFFSTKSISDFSINSSSHNLIERYFMFKITFGF